MDNREFAQVLLSEATEILNEAGARQKYLKVLADKQDKLKERMKREEKLISHGKSDKDLNELRKQYDELADEASKFSARVGVETGLTEKGRYASDRTRANNEKYTNVEKSEEMHNKLNNRRDISAALKNKEAMHGKYSNDLGEYNRYGTGSYAHNISNNDKRAKDAFNQMIEEKSYSNKLKNQKVHDLLNARVAKIKKAEEEKKSQNESIAILLTEAALLLTEAVGVKDRSTDKIVKTFKTNEEAARWVGGNDRYQLTNRLK